MPQAQDGGATPAPARRELSEWAAMTPDEYERGNNAAIEAWFRAALPLLPTLDAGEITRVASHAIDAACHLIGALRDWPMVESAGEPAVDRWGARRPLPTGDAGGAATALDALARIATTALGLVEEVRRGGISEDRRPA